MTNHEPIRILIVDDSRIFRGILESVFQGLPGAQVVGSVFSGEKALEFIENDRPDLITLDIEMPGMGGLAALRAIRELQAKQKLRAPSDIVLVSSLTKQGARCTIEGLQLGAMDFVLKPQGANEDENLACLRSVMQEKLETVRARKFRLTHRGASSSHPITQPVLAHRTTRASLPSKFQAIAIGISTGGPEALAHMLPELTKNCHLPIIIVQHILPGFSGFLAESLSKRLGRRVLEAFNNLPVALDGIYLAPTQTHLVVRQVQAQVVFGLSDTPPENGFRPSADVLFRSASNIYGASLIAAVMTGMGSDGAKGIAHVSRAGGYVLAQDEASSTVWGMPKSAIETGLVNAIVPLNLISTHITQLVGKHP